MSKMFAGFTDEQRGLIEKDRVYLLSALKEIIIELESSKTDDEIVRAMDKITFHGNEIKKNLQSLNIVVV